MSITLELNPNVNVVRIHGDLDGLLAPKLKITTDAILQQVNDKPVLIDLALCHLLTSAGIGVLIYMYKKFNAHGRLFCVQNMDEHVRSSLEIVGVLPHFKECDGRKCKGASCGS